MQLVLYTIYYTYHACIQSGSAIMDHTSCAMNVCIATQCDERGSET